MNPLATTERTIPGATFFNTDEQSSNNSSASDGDNPIADLVMHVILMNQLLPQIAAQYPGCRAAIEKVLQASACTHLDEPDTEVRRAVSPLDAKRHYSRDAAAQPFPEHFTRRELDILQMMLEGLSNREIADRLVVMTSTVKWYVNQIYSKLHVHSRDQAIRRTQELALSDRLTSNAFSLSRRVARDEAAAAALSFISHLRPE